MVHAFQGLLQPAVFVFQPARLICELLAIWSPVFHRELPCGLPLYASTSLRLYFSISLLLYASTSLRLYSLYFYTPRLLYFSTSRTDGSPRQLQMLLPPTAQNLFEWMPKWATKRHQKVHQYAAKNSSKI